MTTNRAESGGVLPPEKAIEFLERCATEGRELSELRPIPLGALRTWVGRAAHVVRRSFREEDGHLADFKSIGSSIRPTVQATVGEELERIALAMRINRVSELAGLLRLDLELGAVDKSAPTRDGAATQTLTSTAPPSNKVFVVHGHDHGAKSAVARFIERLGPQAVILHEQASGGRTVLEKLVAHGDVGFAVVLLTPDDVGGPKDRPKEQRPRARQNVVLELGYFLGLLGRSRVCALHVDGVELPSDFDGVVYVRYDNDSGPWRIELARELRNAGLPVNAEALLGVDGR